MNKCIRLHLYHTNVKSFIVKLEVFGKCFITWTILKIHLDITEMYCL